MPETTMDEDGCAIFFGKTISGFLATWHANGTIPTSVQYAPHGSLRNVLELRMPDHDPASFSFVNLSRSKFQG